MRKKYVVRLTDEERIVLLKVVRKFKGSSQKVRRAQILLKADAEGPGWTDRQIAEAFNCRTKMVENVRQHLVERGFEQTLNGIKPSNMRSRPHRSWCPTYGPYAVRHPAETVTHPPFNPISAETSW